MLNNYIGIFKLRLLCLVLLIFSCSSSDNVDNIITYDMLINGYTGKGTYIYDDSSKYVGEYLNGMRHGKGIYSYKDGEMSEGQFKYDKKHGKGKYSYTDGESYEGEYKNDMMHGYGIYIFSDGKVLEGKWEKATFVGR